MNAYLQPEESHHFSISAWKHAISLGNQAFLKGEVQGARIKYQTALYIAHTMLESASDLGDNSSIKMADSLIAAMVVTEHNLADLYAQSGLLGYATDHLCSAHKTLFALISHSAPELARLAQQHMTMTRMELLAFLQKYGDNPQISETLCATSLQDHSVAH
jgi:hypothetical protein